MKHIAGVMSLILTLSCSQLLAQENWESDGEIEDVEIEIVKDRDIKLPHVNRNFEKIAPVSLSEQTGELTYFYNTINFQLPGIDLKMRPLRMKDQTLSKFYGNYLKAGFGNYVTPYFEGFVNSKRNRHYAYGTHLNYINAKNGPVDDENSGSGRLDMDVFGKAFGKQATLSGDLGYSRRNYHFYGYDDNIEVNADSIKQIYNSFKIAGAVENTKQSDIIQYKLGLGYNYLTDDYKARENEFIADFKGEYTLSDEAFVKIDADLSLITREDELFKVSRNLFKVQPKVGFSLEGFNLHAGFNVVYENDTLGSSDELHFYPMARASYDISSVLEVYAGIRGDIEKQSLRSISESDPYIQANRLLFHNNKTFDFYGGVNGKLNNKIGFAAGLSLANYKNLHYYINDPSDMSKFLVAYDTESAAVANLFGELTLTEEAFRATFRGDYWGYNTNDQVGGEAWHRPNYKLSLISTYNLYDKLIFNAEFYSFGGMKALDLTNNQEINLEAAFDLSLKADYLISKQVSAFVQFSNIFSQSYEQYYRYPTRQLQFMAGITYSF